MSKDLILFPGQPITANANSILFRGNTLNESLSVKSGVSFLQIWGELGGATLILKSQSADGTFESTGDDIAFTLSSNMTTHKGQLFTQDLSDFVVYRLDLIGATGTTSIKAAVKNGMEVKPTT